MPAPPEHWSRLGGVSLAVSGILFVAFPVIRPFTDASPDPLVVAQTFASTAWIFAHVLALVAFALMPIGLVGLSRRLERSPGEEPAFWGVVLCCIGVGLALPFFGIEVFSLGVIGARAVAQSAPDLVALAQSIRVGLGVWFFFVGLVLVALGAILIAMAVWGLTEMERCPVEHRAGPVHSAVCVFPAHPRGARRGAWHRVRFARREYPETQP